ncbi:MAG TPA: glucose-1-phosphate adenylyltransferase subunit GlgD [Clostridiaceae bacterium]|nr:glucose-1-phosphate adenylyltransferase subunit GlgD [Clostridiaceae bacterium]
MLSKTMGLILADHHRIHLSELNQPRALAAMPFGGRYRIIDFTLSNMVNSGIKQVGVIALSAYKSLMDHLGTGASWDLDRMQQGLYLLPPYINAASIGDDSDLTGLLDFFSGSTQQTVVICDANIVMNYTFEEMVRQFNEGNQDILALYNRDGNQFGSPVISLDLDRRGFVRDVMIDALEIPSQRSFLGAIVVSRDLITSIIAEAIARGQTDFSLERILKMYTQYRIRGYEYKGKSLRINSVAGYFNASMRLLDSEFRQALFNEDTPIYTKVKNAAPAVYEHGSGVTNALCSDGCRIYGDVRNSILFRNVMVAKHATVENCVIFQDVQISEGAHLSNVILDKDCVVRMGVKLQGHPDYPVVIRKGAIV